MTERERLIGILESADLGCIKAQCYNCDHYNSPWKGGKQPLCREYRVADHLIANGVTFTPAVPGHKDQYNIAEMAYENGFAKGFTQGYEEGKHKPEKRGRWIIHSSGHGRNATNWAECSECRVCGSPQWKVCPVCETRMENHSAINIEEVDFDYAAED
jgi:hypothetical protein